MFDFIETMNGRIPEDIIDIFLNISGDQGKEPWELLQLCMIDYIKQNNSAYLDPSEMSREERFLFSQVVDFWDLFEDMRFDEDSIVGEYIKVQYGDGKGSFEDGIIAIPHAIRYFDPQQCTYRVKGLEEMVAWGAYNSAECCLTLREDVLRDDAILLHEMIHMHEHVLQKVPHYYREILLLALYKTVKPQIAERGFDLDQLIFGHSNVAEAQRVASIGGEHGILFYLKSLDLDLKMEYELGTVCGYGRKVMREVEDIKS